MTDMKQGIIVSENSSKPSKSFFRNDKDRNLWIRLNAERIRYSNEVVNNIKTEDLGSIDEQYTSMWVSNNQLEYDERMCKAPRFSLAELASLSQDELINLSRQRNQQVLQELFGDSDETMDEL